MRRAHTWAASAALVVACALPKVEIDASLADAGTSAGTGAGAAGGAGGGSAGRGGSGNAGVDQSDARENACGDYCATYLANCADTDANTYDDSDDCLTTCFTSDWPFGTDQAAINSVQCRQTHAHLAATAQVPHCLHSAEVPMGTSCALP
jgi:hypothetical protein